MSLIALNVTDQDRVTAGCSMLERLPEEIKLKICAELETDGPHGWRGLYSLMALRLTCKAFRFLPNEKIFRVVKLYPSADSLRALESVAQHPEYHQHVQRLEVSSLYLPLYDNYSEWLGRVNGHPYNANVEIPQEQELIRLRDQDVPNNLQEHYSGYLRHRADEDAFLKLESSWLFLQIDAQLTRLPKLTSLSFWMVDGSTRWQGTNLTILEKETLLTRKPDEIKRHCDHVRILRTLFVAFHSANTQLKGLKIYRPSVRFFADEQWKPQWGWSIEDQDWSLPVACSVFSVVEILELQFISTPAEEENDRMSADDQVEDEDEEEALAQFILAFRDLKVLDLSFDTAYHGSLLFEILGSGARWSCLTGLTLHTVTTSKEDLVDLLQAHKTSLRHLKMTEMYLEDGRWMPILRALSTHFMLETVEFDYLFDLQPYLVWWTKSPSKGQDLLSQLRRCILQKDETFPLPLPDAPEDAVRAWSAMSDSSFAYERAEVMVAQTSSQLVRAEISGQY